MPDDRAAEGRVPALVWAILGLLVVAAFVGVVALMRGGVGGGEAAPGADAVSAPSLPQPNAAPPAPTPGPATP